MFHYFTCTYIHYIFYSQIQSAKTGLPSFSQDFVVFYRKAYLSLIALTDTNVEQCHHVAPPPPPAHKQHDCVMQDLPDGQQGSHDSLCVCVGGGGASSVKVKESVPSLAGRRFDPQNRHNLFLSRLKCCFVSLCLGHVGVEK